MKARNLPLPKWAQEIPTVPPHLTWFLNAWWELDTCRSWTQGSPCPIPWTAILQYSQYHGVDMDYMHRLISCMDKEYIGFCTKKAERSFSKTKNNKKPRG